MATRSRIGYVLSDDSIVSVYHHWDGYPEWLGVILNKHYNTDEAVRELIDGGDMSSCYSDNEYDYEKQEFVKRDPAPTYYSERGEDCPPVHHQTFSDIALEEKGVALVPGTSFGDSAKDFVRVSYANSIENLEKAIYKLSEI